jgi:hypothetical protein
MHLIDNGTRMFMHPDFDSDDGSFGGDQICSHLRALRDAQEKAVNNKKPQPYVQLSFMLAPLLYILNEVEGTKQQHQPSFKSAVISFHPQLLKTALELVQAVTTVDVPTPTTKRGLKKQLGEAKAKVAEVQTELETARRMEVPYVERRILAILKDHQDPSREGWCVSSIRYY